MVGATQRMAKGFVRAVRWLKVRFDGCRALAGGPAVVGVRCRASSGCVERLVHDFVRGRRVPQQETGDTATRGSGQDIAVREIRPCDRPRAGSACGLWPSSTPSQIAGACGAGTSAWRGRRRDQERRRFRRRVDIGHGCQHGRSPPLRRATGAEIRGVAGPNPRDP